MKKCNKCNLDKEVCDFHKAKSNKDGHHNICKICRKQIEKEYRDKNPEKHKEVINRYVNSEKGKKTRKKVRREHYLNNKEKENKRSNKWNKDNRDKVREYERNIYGPIRRDRDKHQIMWRGVLHASLRRMGKSKEGKTIDLLGYSPLELKEHLESLFTDDMSWNNYGEWHIDHIKQVCTFSPNTPTHIVNALTNLQPLWATTREINGVIYEGNLNKDKR